MGLEDGKNRLIREVSLLSQALALSVPDEQALAITDEVAFFQAIKARLVKFIGDGNGRSDVDIETTIKQIVDEALSSDQVVDIFDAAGIKKPEISILSEKFLLEIKGMKHQNLVLNC
jgi:type I restriction enzyme R subunit